MSVSVSVSVRVRVRVGVRVGVGVTGGLMAVCEAALPLSGGMCMPGTRSWAGIGFSGVQHHA